MVDQPGRDLVLVNQSYDAAGEAGLEDDPMQS